MVKGIMSGDAPGFIAALDVGTTTIKCQILNFQLVIVGAAYSNVKLHYPKPGYVEIIPDELFKDVIEVISQAVADANIAFAQIKSIGISTQRATFVTWRKDTGEYLHNLITWKDLRARNLIGEVNSSWKFTILKWASSFLHLITRNEKFGMGSKLKFASNHASIRLLWVLLNIEEVKEALRNKNLMFGTLETWLVYKLSGEKTYVTDISNASATGLFDPFDLDWSIVMKILKIPKEILPEVVNNDHNFGVVKKDLFGVPIKIGSVMADQSSSMFGSCCFNENNVKLTVGTGAFLDVNTANGINPSLNGMYPLVGWRRKTEIVYICEVPCSDAGSLIQWLLSIGLITDPSQTSDMAFSVKDNDGIYFIPAFSGLGPPINNEKAGTGFIGIKPTTTKEHMVRAVLESIVYRIIQSYDLLKKERNRKYKSISIDGGLSKNNFICQLLADIINVPVERFTSSEMSTMGVAFLAGLSCNVWKNTEDLFALCKVDRVFQPTNSQKQRETYKNEICRWIAATRRFESWYN